MKKKASLTNGVCLIGCLDVHIYHLVQNSILGQAVVVSNFNLSTREAEIDENLSSRLTWTTEQVPGQPQRNTEILS